MADLIPIVERDGKATVNARDLHAFLEVGTAFKDWIARRVEDYGFSDGKDFCSFLSESSGGRPAKEYALTLDMAKELAMVERNEKGKQARSYFIECERRAKSVHVDPMTVLADPAALRTVLLTYTEKVIALEAIVSEQQPKVEALDRIATADGSMCVTDAAKTLGVQPKKLFQHLRENKWVYQRIGSSNYIGYQDKIASGLLEHKITVVARSDGSEKTVTQVRIMPKGIARLACELGEWPVIDANKKAS